MQAQICIRKKVDVIGTRRKRQRDIGQFEAMQYFDGNKDTTLMWSALLFSNDKGPTGGGKAISTENECHCQKELMCGYENVSDVCAYLFSD